MDMDRRGRLAPFDELALMDHECRVHGEEMRHACAVDPVEGMADPIDGVSREFPNDVAEPLPDLF